MSELVEIWKPVVGWEDSYMVSNFGRVKSLDRWIKTGRGGLQFREGVILKGKLDKDGYPHLGLYKNGKCKFFTIHRLVAQAFLPNPNNLPQVNHKDENKTNNCVDNLEWCNAKYNINYGTRNNRISNVQRNDKKKSKPVVQLTLDNKISGIYPSIKEAARQIGIGSTEISKCCKNKPKHNTAGGFKWLFLDEVLADILEKIQDECINKEKAA